MTSCAYQERMKYDREFAWVQCAKAQWGSGSAFWGSVHWSMRSKCHQPSPRNSKRRKIDSRSSCPSHLACEWTVSGGQNEARAGRTWMDFGFFSGMTRFQKLKVITDLPLRLVALAPFFRLRGKLGVAMPGNMSWAQIWVTQLRNVGNSLSNFIQPSIWSVNAPCFFLKHVPCATCLFCSLAKLFPSFHKTYFSSIIMFWRRLQIGAGHTIASWAHLLRLRRSGETQVSLQRDGCQRNEEFCPVEAYWFWMNLLAKAASFWKESVPD